MASQLIACARPRAVLVLPLIAVLGLAACSDMSSTEQRSLSGAGIGAAAGTVVGAISGHTLWGAAIGTAAGAASGFLYDRYKQSQQTAFEKGYAAGQQSGN